MKNKCVIAVISLIILSFVQCTNLKINSKWNDSVVIIDGNEQEWRGSQLVPKGQHYAFGIMNDSTDIYISFRTADPNLVMQILGNGFTIFIDPKGKPKKTWGIRYPLQQRRVLKSLMQLRRVDFDEFDRQLVQMLEFQNQYEIVENNEDIKTKYPMNNANGIEIQATLEKGEFLYELKLPMRLPELVLKKEQGIGVGIEIGSMERPTMRPDDSSEMRGNEGERGGGRGGSGMSSGGRDGNHQGNQQSKPSMSKNETVKLWMHVTLAKN